mgnify:CR=1 FL=1
MRHTSKASLCEEGGMTEGHDGGREWKHFILSPSLASLDSPLSEGAGIRVQCLCDITITVDAKLKVCSSNFPQR